MLSHLLFGAVFLLGTAAFVFPLERPAAFASVQDPAARIAEATPLPDGAVLLILNPLLRFERVADEAEFHVPAPEAQKFKASLTQAARYAVETIHLKPEDAGERANDSVSAIESLSSRLARGHVTDEARPLLADLARAREPTLILAQFFRVKEGPGGAWDPSTGAIRSSTSGAELHAALIDCVSGDVLWRSAMVIRKRPRPDDRRFQEELTRFFKTLGAPRQQRRK